MTTTTSMSLSTIVLPKLQTADGKPMANSCDVARVFGKHHHHVLRDIEALDVPEGWRQSNFGSASYRDAQGKLRKAYTMTRDGFTLLAMGFTGRTAMQFKLAYIEAFNRMEAELQTPAAPPMLEEVLQRVRQIGRRYEYPAEVLPQEERDPRQVAWHALARCEVLTELLDELEADGHEVAGPRLQLQALWLAAIAGQNLQTTLATLLRGIEQPRPEIGAKRGLLAGRRAIAKYLDAHVETVDRWRKRRQDPLPVMRPGHTCLADPAELDAWVQRQNRATWAETR